MRKYRRDTIQSTIALRGVKSNGNSVILLWEDRVNTYNLGLAEQWEKQ